MDKQLVIRLPEKQKFLLENLAERMDISVSELTRQAINQFVNRKKGAQNPLLKLAQIGQNLPGSGPKDLSSNYKKYLYNK